LVGPERILEEVVDTMLAVLSAAYHLGFSDEQIDAEMARKSTFWADRQAAEGAAVLPFPFEHARAAFPTLGEARVGLGA